LAKRRNRIGESFIAHPKSMRESWAWRLLPDNARRVLDRLELEHMRQGGAMNGELKCTYTDFEEAGLRRQSVALAIRQAAALGFVEITRKGYKTAAEFRVPSLYRLTYVYNADARRQGMPTNEWERIAGKQQAEAALQTACAEDAAARGAFGTKRERRKRRDSADPPGSNT
jgi:hypothetical protein